MDDFPSRIRLLRGHQTAAEIAAVFGVTQPAWTQWEKGLREPRLDTVEKICRHFGVSADWLLGLSDDQHSGPTPGVVPPSTDIGQRDCRDCPLMQAAAQVTNKQRGRKLTS
jgi:transcriptional regulator with XRE-family HTH domain